MDPFGRIIDYLRISVTDRCDERCLYCMPESYAGWQESYLSAKEILRVARVAAELGFRKFRLTGGEPLVRRHILEIVSGIAGIPGVQSIGLSTNGTRLEQMAGALKAAGLRTVNISLDALDEAVYKRITGGDVKRVLAGIRAALATGFEFIKLNCVLLRGLNETELWPLVLFAAEHRVPLRLIELMPFTREGGCAQQKPVRHGVNHFLPIEHAMWVLSEKDELIAQPETRIGWGPAKYYALRHSGATVGFIGSLTDRHFCESCNKVRLTADGKIRPCLGADGEMDLREVASRSDEVLRELLLKAISRKPLRHGFGEQFSPSRPMTAIGG